MTEPATSAAAAVVTTATGLTIFGLATGLDPGALFAAFAGSLFAIAFHEPMPILKRMLITVGASVLATWLAQAAALAAVGMPWWPDTLPAGVVLYPMAATIGMLMYKVIAPKLMVYLERKADSA